MNDFLVLSLPVQVGHVRTTELVYHCIKQMAIFVAVRDRTKETIVKRVRRNSLFLSFKLLFNVHHDKLCSQSKTSPPSNSTSLQIAD